MTKRALIFGITGQDGSYLADLLLEKGYEVHGIVRRSSTPNTQRIDHCITRLNLHTGDLSDFSSTFDALAKIQPHEVYNLAAQSHVKTSFDVPTYTGDATGLGTVRLLEAIRLLKIPGLRFYQASSSEMFGASPPPQSEVTPFYPRSPYGCAKVYSYWITVNYREAYNLHASNGVLFNHESPRRGENFVTRKIARAAARISAGKQDALYLGNLDAKRDWGHARDFVEAMWLMLQQEAPGDYVVATGETHSVHEFVDAAFRYVGIPDWRKVVFQDPALFRPTEVDVLLGDSTKAREALGWKPKVTFNQLVKEMVDAEVKAL